MVLQVVSLNYGPDVRTLFSLAFLFGIFAVIYNMLTIIIVCSTRSPLTSFANTYISYLTLLSIQFVHFFSIANKCTVQSQSYAPSNK